MLEVKKAAAGSGKTYLLTEEYLKLLLGFINSKNVPQIYYNKRTSKVKLEAHKKILAITFTNKATEEMKQRIVKELYLLSTGKKCDHRKELCRYYNVSADIIDKAAAKALSELLFDFSRFNISTIDSFFQTILRTFTREANIGAEYGLELREESAINNSTTDLIHALRKNGSDDNRKLHGWLKQYIISKIDSKKSWNIFSDNEYSIKSKESLYSIAQEIGKEEFKSHKKGLLKFLEGDNSLTKFKANLNKAIERCDQNKISYALKIYEIAGEKAIKGSVKNFVKLIIEAQGNYDGIDLKLTDSFMNSYSDHEKWLPKNAKIDEKAIADISFCLNKIVEAESYKKTYGLMGKNIYALGLLGKISKNLQTFREENDIILISDTNEYLTKIIGQDDAPFIYERVGLNLKHFLIDEFQDTSNLQMDNIKPLITESLAHRHYNLIIGDEKQSIYRFRNADPSLLQTKIFKDFYNFIPEACTEVQRSTNWRSEENIVKFNNTFFPNLISQIDSNTFNSSLVEKTYNNVVQNVSPKKEKEKGYINITFIDKPQEEETSEDNSKWEDVATNSTVKLIHQLLERDYKASDIAILVNKKEEGSKIINAILQDNESNGNEQKLNVISDQSLLLTNSPTINLIISILEYIDCSNTVKSNNDKEEEKHRNVLKVLQTYHKLLAQNEKTPSEALREALEKNSEVISENELDNLVKNVTSESNSLYLIIEGIIQNFISAECRKNEAPFLFAFQDIILEYCAHSTPTIHEFLKWWKLCGNSISITSPTNIDAIKVMTIHKSKGLEFPCVIIPFANWDISSFTGLVWLETTKDIKDDLNCDTPPIIPVRYSKDIANTCYNSQFKKITTDMLIDNLNKTYVALTRAGKEMHIFAPQVDNGKNNDKFSRYLIGSLTLQSKLDSGDTIDFSKGVIDENHFEFGEPLSGKKEERKEDEKKEDEKEKIVSIPVKEYSTGMKKGELSFIIPEINEKYESAEEGNRYHNIMSFIKYRDDLPHALDISVAKNIINKEDREKFNITISKWLDNPKTKNWFNKKYQILTERALCLESENLRSDRIIIDTENNTATVIDYKFGKEHDPRYKKKISKYMKVLELSGYKKVEGFLWYPFEDYIEKI